MRAAAIPGSLASFFAAVFRRSGLKFFPAKYCNAWPVGFVLCLLLRLVDHMILAREKQARTRASMSACIIFTFGVFRYLCTIPPSAAAGESITTFSMDSLLDLSTIRTAPWPLGFPSPHYQIAGGDTPPTFTCHIPPASCGFLESTSVGSIRHPHISGIGGQSPLLRGTPPAVVIFL